MGVHILWVWIIKPTSVVLRNNVTFLLASKSAITNVDHVFIIIRNVGNWVEMKVDKCSQQSSKKG